MDDYIILIKHFENLNQEAHEVVIDMLYDLGVEGVEIIAPWSKEDLSQTGGDYFDIEQNPPGTTIKAYIKKEDYQRNKKEIDNLIGFYDIEGVEAKEKWMLAYQKYFTISKPGKRFVIVPAWMEYTQKDEELVIKIDPSIAFGTGSHPTTKNVLLLMEDMDFNGKKVADVGAGSGILTYGAFLLGARKIIAIDIDDDAVKVSKDNLKHIPEIEFKVNNLLDGIDEKFDIIIANIVADVIIRLSDYLETNLVPGGAFLVSGIIDDKWPSVLEKMVSSHMRLEHKIEEDGWVTACFIKE